MVRTLVWGLGLILRSRAAAGTRSVAAEGNVFVSRTVLPAGRPVVYEGLSLSFCVMDDIKLCVPSLQYYEGRQ